MGDPLCTCSGSLNGPHFQCSRCASGGYEWRLVPKNSPQYMTIVKPVIITNAHPCMCGTSYASSDTMGNCGRCGGKR